MKRITLIFILSFSILLSCSDENNKLIPSEESLTGFWLYEKVSFNGTDISQLSPDFTINNSFLLRKIILPENVISMVRGVLKTET